MMIKEIKEVDAVWCIAIDENGNESHMTIAEAKEKMTSKPARKRAFKREKSE